MEQRKSCSRYGAVLVNRRGKRSLGTMDPGAGLHLAGLSPLSHCRVASGISPARPVGACSGWRDRFFRHLLLDNLAHCFQSKHSSALARTSHPGCARAGSAARLWRKLAGFLHLHGPDRGIRPPAQTVDRSRPADGGTDRLYRHDEHEK